MAPGPAPAPTARRLREENSLLGGVDAHALYALIPFFFLLILVCLRIVAGLLCRGYCRGGKRKGSATTTTTQHTRIFSGGRDDAELISTVEAPFDWIIDDLHAIGGAASEALDAQGRAVGWTEQWDEQVQAHYYWNTITDETTWERPSEVLTSYQSKEERTRLAKASLEVGRELHLKSAPEDMDKILLRHRIRSNAEVDASVGVFDPRSAYSSLGSFLDKNEETEVLLASHAVSSSSQMMPQQQSGQHSFDTGPLAAMMASMRPDTGSFKRALDDRTTSQWIRPGGPERPQGGWAAVATNTTTTVSQNDPTAEQQQQAQALDEYFNDLHRRRGSPRKSRTPTPAKNPRPTLKPIIESSPERRPKRDADVLAAVQKAQDALEDGLIYVGAAEIARIMVDEEERARLKALEEARRRAEEEARRRRAETRLMMIADEEARRLEESDDLLSVLESEPSEEPPPVEVDDRLRLQGLSFVSTVILQPFGVLGVGIDATTGKINPNLGPSPLSMPSVCICDPARLHHIQPPGGPKEASGAAGAIYKWLGVDQNASFPAEVVAVVKESGDAKYHEYVGQIHTVSDQGRAHIHDVHVVHSVGPDFRRKAPYTRDEACEVLTRAYANTLSEFVVSDQKVLRLLPISGGIFSGPFKDEIARLTWDALATAFTRLRLEERQALTMEGTEVHLCLFDQHDVPQFTRAGFSSPDLWRQGLNFVLTVVLQPFGVLGVGIDAATSEVNPNLGPSPTDMPSVCICDPAGLHHIQPPGGPKGAGGAAGAIYKWLGIDQETSFPADVIAAVKEPGDAKLHRYRKQITIVTSSGRKKKCDIYVVHSVGPDLRATNEKFEAYTRSEACAVLTRAYANTLSEFVVSKQNVLRLLPISGGIFSGPFKGEIARLAWDALATAFVQLEYAEKQALTVGGKEVHLCIFDQSEVPRFEHVGFSQGKDGPSGPGFETLDVHLGNDGELEDDPDKDLWDVLATEEEEPEQAKMFRAFSDQAMTSTEIDDQHDAKAAREGKDGIVSTDAVLQVEEDMMLFSDQAITGAEDQGHAMQSRNSADGIVSTDKALHLEGREGRDADIIETVEERQRREAIEAAIAELEVTQYNVKERRQELVRAKTELRGLLNPTMERRCINGVWETAVLVVLQSGEQMWGDYEQWNGSVEERRGWLRRTVATSKRFIKDENRKAKILLAQLNEWHHPGLSTMPPIDDDDDDSSSGGSGSSSSSGSSSEEDNEQTFEELEDGTEEPLAGALDKMKIECFGDSPALEMDVVEVGAFVGQGSFGAVFRGRYCGHRVILKDLSGGMKSSLQDKRKSLPRQKKRVVLDDGCLAELSREASTVWRHGTHSGALGHGFQHAYLVDVIGFSGGGAGRGHGASSSSSTNPPNNGGALLVVEQASCSLHDLLHSSDIAARGKSARVDPSLLRILPLSMHQRLLWLRQIALGMAAAHKLTGRPHLCLTSKNVLLAADTGRCHAGCVAKVSDFCFPTLRRRALEGDDSNRKKLKKARLLSFNPLLDCRALPWLAPEVIDAMGLEAATGQRPGFAADVFSFSVLLWEVVTGALPHEGQPPQRIVEFVLKNRRRLELPSDDELGDRWSQLIGNDGHDSYSNSASSHGFLASDRVAHKPLPRGRAGGEQQADPYSEYGKKPVRKPTTRKKEERRRRRLIQRRQQSFKRANAGKPIPSLRQLWARCVLDDPRQRPTFDEIAEDLGHLIRLLPTESALPPPLLAGISTTDEGGDARRTSLRASASFSSFNFGAPPQGADDDGGDEESSAKNSPSKKKGKKSTFSRMFGGKSKGGDGAGDGAASEAVDPHGVKALCESPVAFVNADNGRKLFAQANKRPGLFEDWSKGFGAGPEMHLFDDNRWWILPQHSPGAPEHSALTDYVILNVQSVRRLYALQFRAGTKQNFEKGVGAIAESASHYKQEREYKRELERLERVDAQLRQRTERRVRQGSKHFIVPDEDTAAASAARAAGGGGGSSSSNNHVFPDQRWQLLRQSDGTFLLQNRASDRVMFARQPRPGEAWHRGVGAAVPQYPPPRNCLWHIVPLRGKAGGDEEDEDEGNHGDDDDDDDDDDHDGHDDHDDGQEDGADDGNGPAVHRRFGGALAAVVEENVEEGSAEEESSGDDDDNNDDGGNVQTKVDTELQKARAEAEARAAEAERLRIEAGERSAEIESLRREAAAARAAVAAAEEAAAEAAVRKNAEVQEAAKLAAEKMAEEAQQKKEAEDQERVRRRKSFRESAGGGEGADGTGGAEDGAASGRTSNDMFIEKMKAQMAAATADMADLLDVPVQDESAKTSGVQGSATQGGGGNDPLADVNSLLSQIEVEPGGKTRPKKAVAKPKPRGRKVKAVDAPASYAAAAVAAAPPPPPDTAAAAAAAVDPPPLDLAPAPANSEEAPKAHKNKKTRPQKPKPIPKGRRVSRRAAPVGGGDDV